MHSLFKTIKAFSKAAPFIGRIIATQTIGAGLKLLDRWRSAQEKKPMHPPPTAREQILLARFEKRKP